MTDKPQLPKLPPRDDRIGHVWVVVPALFIASPLIIAHIIRARHSRNATRRIRYG